MTWQMLDVIGEDENGDEAVVRAGVNIDQLAMIIESDTKGRAILRFSNGDEIEVAEDAASLYDGVTDDFWTDSDLVAEGAEEHSPDDDDDDDDDTDEIPFNG